MGTTLSGREVTQMSSKNANIRSSCPNCCCKATKALCCPKLKRAGMSASPRPDELRGQRPCHLARGMSKEHHEIDAQRATLRGRLPLTTTHHGLTRHEVERPNSVDREHCPVRAGVSLTLEDVAKTFTTGARRQIVLEGRCCTFNCWGQLLCDGPCDQSSYDITCHDASDTSCGFLQGCDSAHAKSRQNFFRDVPTSKALAHAPESCSTMRRLEHSRADGQLTVSPNWTSASAR